MVLTNCGIEKSINRETIKFGYRTLISQSLHLRATSFSDLNDFRVAEKLIFKVLFDIDSCFEEIYLVFLGKKIKLLLLKPYFTRFAFSLS